MKINAFLSNLLTNKLVLTIIFWLSLTNIIGYLIYGKFDIVVYFILIALILYNFSKNMIIVLGAPLILVNFYVLGKSRFKEGLENKPNDATTTTPTRDPSANATQKAEIKADISEHVDPETKASLGQGGFEVGRNKGKSKYNIDYASTVEDAYDELNNILGSDGIKSLTSDTQNLMQQQKQLTEAMSQISPLMNNIGPLLKQAQTMMGTMKSNGGVDQLNQLAKQFNPSAIPKPTK